ncbi:MAG: exodeoxyribonuclease VII large subunit [Desulfuromusa sp.]|nr:exodeoxyribonuclease VII large subunit [Desulfuromusa sp.]
MDVSTAVSVSTLVQLLQELVEDNFVEVLVQGELSNVSQPPSGHCYFTLKDKRAQIKCAMFRSQVRALRFKPTDGLAVICRGRVSIYPQRGDLQLIVEGIEPEGVGALQLAFEQLKEKLEKEGLFAAGLKQPLPNFPQVIGVVTSSSGAAIHDILNILKRRSSGLQVVLRSVRVQGEGAAAEIAAAVADLNRETTADVLIVGRGGGAREDLWAFNEEIVARAIASSKIPVISAVGHEIDFSIADLVADLRAPTPSAAAELVVKNRLDLERHLDQLILRLAAQMRSRLLLLSSSLHGLEKRLKAPAELVKIQRLQLQQLSLRLHQEMTELLAEQQHRLALLLGQLQTLSPLSVLSRGYAIVKQKQTGEVIHAAEQLRLEDQLQIQLADGEVVAIVKKITAKGEK